MKQYSKVDIEKLRAGDSKEQYHLFKAYYGRLIGIPLRYTSSKEEAHEILNTGFYKAFASINNYKHDQDIGGWLAKIMLNTSIDFIRKKIKYVERNSFDESGSERASTSESALDTLSLQDLYNEIQNLPPATRNVFSLYAIDGFKHREIAQLLNISSGTSKWHLANARTLLQKRIKQIGYA